MYTDLLPTLSCCVCHQVSSGNTSTNITISHPRVFHQYRSSHVSRQSSLPCHPPCRVKHHMVQESATFSALHRPSWKAASCTHPSSNSAWSLPQCSVWQAGAAVGACMCLHCHLEDYCHTPDHRQTVSGEGQDKWAYILTAPGQNCTLVAAWPFFPWQLENQGKKYPKPRPHRHSERIEECTWCSQWQKAKSVPTAFHKKKPKNCLGLFSSLAMANDRGIILLTLIQKASILLRVQYRWSENQYSEF